MVGDPETEARAACAAGHWDRAVTALLGAYGQELLEYLIAVGRSEADGRDAYSRFAERLWRGLPRFRWDTSGRAWCYLVARHALSEIKRASPVRRARHLVPLSESPGLAAADRTRTRTFLRTAARDAFAAARAALSPRDQELLVLRIDRRLAWRDIARILFDGEDGPALERRTVALRKRFEDLKTRLRAAVRAA